MRRPILVSALICLGALVLCVAPVRAEGPAAGSTPASLDPVVWAGQGTTLEALKGKTVVILTYVTWCPKCNAWSGDIVSGLNKSIAEKPVIVLAISTDTPPAKARAYMEERKFTGPQILHGYDPTIARRLEFTNEFFNYAIVGPDGKVATAGNASSFYEIDGGKLYSPAYDLKQQPDLGKFRFLTDDMSGALKELIFPMELGTFPTAGDATRLKKGLSADDRRAFERTMTSFLDEQLAEAERLAGGETSEKLAAFDTAAFLTGNFKGTEQGKKARKILTDLNKEKELKRELAAKRLYDEAMKAAQGDADRQTELLRNLARKFPDTHFAKLAASAAEEAAKPRDPSASPE
jgi:hypothetical protein